MKISLSCMLGMHGVQDFFWLFSSLSDIQRKITRHKHSSTLSWVITRRLVLVVVVVEEGGGGGGDECTTTCNL